MRRIVLLSSPNENNIKEILSLTFPEELKNKILAYLPSDGANCPEIFLNEWRDYAKKHNCKFNYIDNSKSNSEEEKRKLLESNILVITGGNTFVLLNNLKSSGLFEAIKEFANKKEFVITGFSAGAIVLTPNIKTASLPPSFDDNWMDLKDLSALNLIKFEVYPHYDRKESESALEQYLKTTTNKIKTMTEDEYVVENI